MWFCRFSIKIMNLYYTNQNSTFNLKSNSMILSISLDTFYSKILMITCAYRNKYSWSVAKWIFIPIRTENFYAVDFCVS